MKCRVGLPSDGKKRWRCDICSLLNIYEKDVCGRCEEPFDDDRKKQNVIRNQLHSKPMPYQSTSNTNFAANKNNRNAIKKQTKKSKDSTIYEFNKNKKIKKMSNTLSNSKKMKKVRKPDLSKKHLGYKTKNKGNIRYSVKSKLNYDTASYRAKFVGKGNPKDRKSTISGMKAGVNYATINDLTKNGFQTSLSSSSAVDHKKQKSKYVLKPIGKQRAAVIRRLVDEKPVTPPPKQKGKKKRSLIDRLQNAHSGDIMANLKSKGRYVRAEKKRMEGGTSKYSL